MLKPSDLPPIKSWEGEAFNFENKIVYDVYRAIISIHADPEGHQFGMVKLEQLFPQLDGRGNMDASRIKAMSEIDATRPVLVATQADGTVRLIDGYHRATWCRNAGVEGIAAWILSREQTALIECPFTGQVQLIR